MSNRYPDDVRYHPEHGWVRTDGAARCGITWYAQDQLGDIVFVELPTPGDTLTAGQPYGTIESLKTVSDLIAPISGTVTTVHAELDQGGAVVNTDPYGRGWMVEVTVTDGVDSCSTRSPTGDSWNPTIRRGRPAVPGGPRCRACRRPCAGAIRPYGR